MVQESPNYLWQEKEASSVMKDRVERSKGMSEDVKRNGEPHSRSGNLS
jgi:hypothetical protein